jgi:hypothetical protein
LGSLAGRFEPFLRAGVKKAVRLASPEKKPVFSAAKSRPFAGLVGGPRLHDDLVGPRGRAAGEKARRWLFLGADESLSENGGEKKPQSRSGLNHGPASAFFQRRRFGS